MCLCVSVQRAARRSLMNRTPRVKTYTHIDDAAAADVIDADKKIDWHDYTQLARDQQRTGTCHSQSELSTVGNGLGLILIPATHWYMSQSVCCAVSLATVCANLVVRLPAGEQLVLYCVCHVDN